MKECLYCGNKEINEEWMYCGECGTNIDEYKTVTKLIKEGEKLEKEFRYEEAANTYRKALKLRVPQDKILEYLDRVTKKEQEIISLIEKGKEYMEKKKWGKAIKIYDEILKRNPSREWGVNEDLIIIQKEWKKMKIKKIIIGIVVCIFVGIGLILWRNYKNNPVTIAREKIKQSLLSKDVKAKISAINTVMYLKDKKLLPLVKDVITHSHPEVRIAAIKAIAEFKDTTMKPILEESLRDKNWRVRIAAVEGLIAMGDTSKIKMLKDLVK